MDFCLVKMILNGELYCGYILEKIFFFLNLNVCRLIVVEYYFVG